MTTIIILAAIVLGIVGLDQLSKWIVVQNLPLGESYEWIRKVVHFTYVRNEGAAFGILSNHRWVFLVFSAVAIVGLGVYLFRFCKQNWAVKISLAFLIGGGVGNMIDRIAFGYVVDFIELPFLWLPVLNQYFPVFNIADSFVTVGVVLLAVSLIRETIREEKAKNQGSAVPAPENPSPRSEDQTPGDGKENDHE